MVGEINYSILDPNSPAKIAGSFEQGQQNALAMQQAQQTGQMNALALQKAQRGMKDEETVRNVLSQSGGDYGKASDELLKAGQYKQGLELKTKMAEQQKAKIAQAVEQVKLMKGLANSVFVNPTPETAMAALQQFAQATGGDVSAEVAAIQNMAPEQIKQWAAGHALEADKILPKLTSIDMGGTGALVAQDPMTGKVLSRQDYTKTMTPEGRAADARGWAGIAVAKDANAAAREVAGAKRTQDVEMKLSDDYRAESKGFAEVSTSMKKVLGSLKTADKNAGSALAAGTAFMKILDPNSVVRESELGMALNASGWFDRASNVVNTMKSGKIMTQEQVKNLTAASNALFEEAKKAQLEVDASFKQRANSYGANPQNIITDRGQASQNNSDNGYGNRADGTPKANGFLGPLKTADGRTSTEISVGVNIGGKETEIPTLVPGLSKAQVDSLLRGEKPSKEIVKIAVDHAKKRIAQGKSPFAENNESPNQPTVSNW